MASKEQIDALKAKAQELLDAVAAIPVDDAAPAPAPAPAGDDLAAKLKDLQDKFDALGKSRDEYKAAVETEINDKKSDTARLEKAVADIEHIEVPVVTEVVPVPAAAEPAPAAGSDQYVDSSSKPLNA